MSEKHIGEVVQVIEIIHGGWNRNNWGDSNSLNRQLQRNGVESVRFQGTQAGQPQQKSPHCGLFNTGRDYARTSAPPMYGRSTSGTVMEPSAFW